MAVYKVLYMRYKITQVPYTAMHVYSCIVRMLYMAPCEPYGCQLTDVEWIRGLDTIL